MISSDITFNARNEAYKKPVGAVTSGTEVTFAMYVKNGLAPERVELVMKYDRHDSPAYYEMTPFPGEYDTTGFRASVTIGDTGLYWYHFVLHKSGGETVLIGKDAAGGNAVPTDRPVDWQQTVYQRKYAVPEWICGGAFYHIFVDRFCKGTLRKGDGSRFDICAQSEPASQSAEDQSANAAGQNAEDQSANAAGQNAEDQSANAAGQNADDQSANANGHSAEQPAPPLPEKILRNDWGGTPNWRPVDGKILNNDFFGGDLEGIIEKLPYLSGLGITCLYLSPIFEAYSNHKYDTGDYERVDPMFGDEKTLTELCSKAKQLGIRVILDGVFAHTGSDSRYFDKYGTYGGRGAWGNPDSPYRSWYAIREDGTYDSWWDFETLPKLNKRDPGYTEYMTGENGIVRKWLRAGASGWRLDVADELPCAFLDKVVSAAKAEKRDALVIGEVWEDASNKTAYDERKNYFEGARLDSVMNYPFRTAIIDFVRSGNASGIAETVEQILENYPKEVADCLMNLLGTHDSVRIITALAGEDLGPEPAREAEAAARLDRDGWERGVELLKTASLLQATLPGVPCVYYGDEAGTEGYKDPFNRTCYPWGYENKELRSWYRTILNFRKSQPVYAHGLYRTLAAEDGAYAFVRYQNRAAASNGDGAAVSGSIKTRGAAALITAVNTGNNAVTIDLDGALPDMPAGVLQNAANSEHAPKGAAENDRKTVWSDLLTGRKISGKLVLAPGERYLLEKL